jgi:hypothetical protein
VVGTSAFFTRFVLNPTTAGSYQYTVQAPLGSRNVASKSLLSGET